MKQYLGLHKERKKKSQKIQTFQPDLNIVSRSLTIVERTEILSWATGSHLCKRSFHFKKSHEDTQKLNQI